MINYKVEHYFFLLISQFQRLTIYNQRRLLERNTPLYIQLILGIYFSQDQFKIENQPEEASPSVNFINFLRAFTCADPENCKKTVKLSIFFLLLGSVHVKAACRTLMKWAPTGNRWSTNFLKLIDVESQVQFFRPGTNLDEYGLLINQLRVLSHLKNKDQRAMLAYMILFSCDESILFSDNQVSISSMLYAQLLQAQILKVQKD